MAISRCLQWLGRGAASRNTLSSSGNRTSFSTAATMMYKRKPMFHITACLRIPEQWKCNYEKTPKKCDQLDWCGKPLGGFVKSKRQSMVFPRRPDPCNKVQIRVCRYCPAYCCPNCRPWPKNVWCKQRQC